MHIPNTLVRKTISGESYEVVIVSKHGAVLELGVSKFSSNLSNHDLELLDEVSLHLAVAHEQLSRLERMQRNIKRPGSENHRIGIIGTARGNVASFSQLTKRENEVVGQLGQGLSNADIAHILNISRRTVEKHLETVYRKLGLENRYQLIGEITQ